MTLKEFYELRKEIKRPENLKLETESIVSYTDSDGRIFRFEGNNQVIIENKNMHVLDITHNITSRELTSNYDSLVEEIKSISNNDLLNYCKEIKSFRDIGYLDPENSLIKLCEKYDTDVRVTEGMLMIESHKRYHNIVLLLFLDNPREYLKQ